MNYEDLERLIGTWPTNIKPLQSEERIKPYHMNEVPPHARHAVGCLSRLIQEARLHYTRGQPFMSDYEYDTLEKIMKRICPDHPVLQEVGA